MRATKQNIYLEYILRVISISEVGVVNGGAAGALGREEDQELKATEGHFMEYLDEGSIVT